MIWGRANTQVLMREKTTLAHQKPSPANLPLHNSSYYDHNKKENQHPSHSHLLEAVTGPKTKVSFLSAKQEFYGSYSKNS